MANPTLLTSPIAENGDKNVIPASTGATTGLLDQEHGFQQINELPLQAGGLPPQRKDFNGAFNLLSKILFYVQKGYVFEYDENQDYYAGCVVKDTDGGLYCANTDVSASSTHPKDDTVNWSRYTAYALRSHTYAVGDTSTLPNVLAGYFLECTTAGTTGATAPVITPPVSAGNTIIDGTVVWTVRSVVGSAIVGDSLGPNWYNNVYIKLNDGLIIQRGFAEFVAGATAASVTFPISFISGRPAIFLGTATAGRYVHYDNASATGFTCIPNAAVSYNTAVDWLAIGF